jgi:hypothetical protein
VSATPTLVIDRSVAAELRRVHGAFHRWLGEDFDLDAINAVLATAAAERLTGDLVWLWLIGGPGVAKTETTQSLIGAGALITSTISSDAALLSGTSRKETAKDATGGLLRKLGARGLLVVKDGTSILAMNRDSRASLLAALREVYDGRWVRNIGTDGGRTLTWEGRIAIIGAVTTAWDRAHDVIASMGDRFVMLRMDSTTGRQAAGRQAMSNTGHEIEMRAHLAETVGAVLGRVDPNDAITITSAETDLLLAAADVVTRCRTGVEYDYRGDVIDAHAQEMPTRFAKQLQQVMRGACAIGLDRTAALRLALRCARDSMPPLRLAILEDVAAHPHSKTIDVRRRLNKPRTTIDRQLQALHMLDVLTCDEVEDATRERSSWYYDVADSIDPAVLRVPDLSHTCTSPQEERVSSW